MTIMKNILPILSLATLAAAASAQSAAAASSGFNYNTVTLGYSQEDFKSTGDYIQLTTLSYNTKLSKSFVGTIGLINGSESGSRDDMQGLSVGLGYIYSVSDKLDLVASWSQSLLQTSDGDSQSLNVASYDISARYALTSDLSLTASVGRNNYQHENSGVTNGQEGDFRWGYSVGAAYKLNDQFTVNAKAVFNDSAVSNGDSRGYSVSLSYAY